MDQQVLEAQRAYWNEHFSNGDGLVASNAEWIETLLAEASRTLAGPVLEIGCGLGYDTRYLVESGCQVTSFDLSWKALQHIAGTLPTVRLVNGVLPDPLPFGDGAFAFVVAGLSLHYFRWQDTLAIIGEIGRVLQPDGVLIFRVNSTEDVAHGAGRGDEIEPNLFFYQGRYKRFFTEKMCREIFNSNWQLEALKSRTERRFQEDKPTWMGLSRRAITSQE